MEDVSVFVSLIPEKIDRVSIQSKTYKRVTMCFLCCKLAPPHDGVNIIFILQSTASLVLIFTDNPFTDLSARITDLTDIMKSRSLNNDAMNLKKYSLDVIDEVRRSHIDLNVSISLPLDCFMKPTAINI
jgi:hypothetical protein